MGGYSYRHFAYIALLQWIDTTSYSNFEIFETVLPEFIQIYIIFLIKLN